MRLIFKLSIERSKANGRREERCKTQETKYPERAIDTNIGFQPNAMVNI